MTEIVFLIEEDPEGGYCASAAGADIFAQAETVDELKAQIRDAVVCHFDDERERPRIVRLHFTRDEVMAI
ncbi:MAG TPA: 2-oxoisovalerate dehydrogenase [Candidatus Brocadiia bacterium]|nr:2-oxoisovalerate dehydrogenase [Candidatus Brocadiia bacterium]